jgi:flagellin-like hook-associated protein FlgL
MERISTSMLFDRGVSGMLQQQAKLSKTELQLATGQRIMLSARSAQHHQPGGTVPGQQ